MAHPAGPAPGVGAEPELPRVMGLRDVVLFNITAIVGLRWLTTASSQFGWASLLMWLVAMVVFFIPLAAVVRELTDIDPRAGGIYRWVHRAFGGRPGFVAGWSYWVSNLVYLPALLVSTAAMMAYAGGPRTVPLGDNPVFIGIVSIAGVAIAVGLNVVGLRIGKWLQNTGAFGTWIPLVIFVMIAIVAFALHGSATPLTSVRDLAPRAYDFQSINLFGTLLFAFGGLELAPTLGSEIRDPAATVRRGVVLSGVAIVAMYMVGTAAVLVALPPATVSLTNGIPQATAALVERLGWSVLNVVPALVALMLVFGNVGGVGAWLTGVARLPYAAGVDRALPPAFSRVHPKWKTPYISLLTQGVLAAVFIVLSLAGTTVKAAYLVLAQTTVVLFFIPYLFMFAAYLKLRRVRSPLTTLTGWSGLVSVAFSIVLAFVPPRGDNPLTFELKVAGGVLLFSVVGWLLSARPGVR
jgi:glutamate:GABA antiporter